MYFGKNASGEIDLVATSLEVDGETVLEDATAENVTISGGLTVDGITLAEDLTISELTVTGSNPLIRSVGTALGLDIDSQGSGKRIRLMTNDNAGLNVEDDAISTNIDLKTFGSVTMMDTQEASFSAAALLVSGGAAFLSRSIIRGDVGPFYTDEFSFLGGLEVHAPTFTLNGYATATGGIYTLWVDDAPSYSGFSTDPSTYSMGVAGDAIVYGSFDAVGDLSCQGDANVEGLLNITGAASFKVSSFDVDALTTVSLKGVDSLTLDSSSVSVTAGGASIVSTDALLLEGTVTTINANENMIVKAETGMAISSLDILTINSTGDLTITSGGILLNSENNASLTSETEMEIYAGTTLLLTTEGEFTALPNIFTLKANANILLNSTTAMELNSGAAFSLTSNDEFSITSTIGAGTVTAGTTLDIYSGGSLTLRGNADSNISSTGDMNISSSVLEIKSNAGMVLNSSLDLALTAAQDVAISTGSNYILKSDLTVDESSGGTFSLSAGDFLSLTSKNYIAVDADLELNLSSGNTMLIKSTENFTLNSLAGIFLNSAGNCVVDAQEGITVKCELEMLISSQVTLTVAAQDIVFEVPGAITFSSPLKLSSDSTLTLSSTIETSVSSEGILSLSSDGDTTLSSKGLASISSTGAMTIKGGVDMTVSCGALFTLESVGEVELTSSSFTVTSAGAIELVAAAGITIDATGDIDINSAAVDLDAAGAITIASGVTIDAAATLNSSFLAGGIFTITGGGGVIINSRGLFSIVGGADVNLVSAGILTITSAGDINASSSAFTLEAAGDISLSTGGLLDIQTATEMNIAATSFTLESASFSAASALDFLADAGGILSLAATGDSSLTGGGAVTVTGGGAVTITAGGAVTLTAGKFFPNQGGALAITGGETALSAGNFNIECGAFEINSGNVLWDCGAFEISSFGGGTITTVGIITLSAGAAITVSAGGAVAVSAIGDAQISCTVTASITAGLPLFTSTLSLSGVYSYLQSSSTSNLDVKSGQSLNLDAARDVSIAASNNWNANFNGGYFTGYNTSWAAPGLTYHEMIINGTLLLQGNGLFLPDYTQKHGTMNLFNMTITMDGDTSINSSVIFNSSPPFRITSSSQVANLNASFLEGTTWESPSAIGATTPNTGLFTSLNFTGSMGFINGGSTLMAITTAGFNFNVTSNFTSTVNFTGSPNFTVTSEVIPNLNASFLEDATWESPLAIGSGTPDDGTFLDLTTQNSFTTLNGTFQNVVISPTEMDVNFPLNLNSNVTFSNGPVTFNGSVPFIVSGSGQVTNLNASMLEGTTWESPSAIGGTTPNTGLFTSLNFTGSMGFINGGSTLMAITTAGFNFNVTTNFTAPVNFSGSPNFTVTSSAVIPNLNASLLEGASWESPSGIGTSTPNTGLFTSLDFSGSMGFINGGSTLMAITTAGFNFNVTTNFTAPVNFSGSPNFTVTSSAVIPNLNASLLEGGTWASAGEIGVTVANTGQFTTLNFFNSMGFFNGGSTLMAITTGGFYFHVNSNFTETVNFSGSPNFTVTSSAVIPNLNASLLEGANWESPLAIGTTAPNDGVFLDVTVRSNFTVFNSPSPSVSISPAEMDVNLPLNLNSSVTFSNGPVTFNCDVTSADILNVSGSFNLSCDINITGDCHLASASSIFIGYNGPGGVTYIPLQVWGTSSTLLFEGGVDTSSGSSRFYTQTFGDERGNNPSSGYIGESIAIDTFTFGTGLAQLNYSTASISDPLPTYTDLINFQAGPGIFLLSLFGSFTYPTGYISSTRLFIFELLINDTTVFTPSNWNFLCGLGADGSISSGPWPLYLTASTDFKFRGTFNNNGSTASTSNNHWYASCVRIA